MSPPRLYFPARACLILALLFIAAPPVRSAPPAYDEEMASRMLDMSNAAYCNLEMIQQWDCGPCKTQQAPGGPAGYHAPSVFEGLVDGYGKVQRFGTQAFVAMLPAVGPNNTAGIVVSFRGSSDTLNWLLDFQFLKMVPYGDMCPTCRVHDGFYKSWLSVAGRLVSAVRVLHVAYVTRRGNRAGQRR